MGPFRKAENVSLREAGRSFQGLTALMEKATRLKAKFAGVGCSRGVAGVYTPMHSPLNDPRTGVKVDGTT
jgi:hypothetical protein